MRLQGLRYLETNCLQNVRTLSGTAPNRKASSPSIWWAVSIGPFQVGRSRLRRMRFAMGIQSYFCCLTASRLPGNGIVERSSRSRWLHYAPGAKVLRTRKCLIVGPRSVRRASGLLETEFSVTWPPYPSSCGNLPKPLLFRASDRLCLVLTSKEKYPNRPGNSGHDEAPRHVTHHCPLASRRNPCMNNLINHSERGHWEEGHQPHACVPRKPNRKDTRGENCESVQE